MAIIAVAVKVSGRGPVFFCHERAGRNGTTFRMLKFRTMTPGTYERILANPDLLELYARTDFKLPGDHDGITKLGRVLRKTSLDELPQFIHVVAGKMSLVGVRPIEVAQL